MKRAKRRFDTRKIAERRFREQYCNYHGSPENWFYKRYDKKEQARKKGQCKDRIYSWRCRCEYCLGGLYLKQSVSDHNFREQLEEIDMPFLFPNVLDGGSSGIFDGGHELWYIQVIPWNRFWRNNSHHPKIKPQ